MIICTISKKKIVKEVVKITIHLIVLLSLKILTKKNRVKY